MRAPGIHPEHFSRQLQSGQLSDARIIDVREQEEWDYYHIEPAVHIPMQTIPARIAELPEDKTIYVLCAHGVRSRMVCEYLLERGFENVVNVEGGIAAVAASRGFAYD